MDSLKKALISSTLAIGFAWANSSYAANDTLASFYNDYKKIKHEVYNNPTHGREILSAYSNKLESLPKHAKIDYFHQLSLSYLYTQDFKKAFDTINLALLIIDTRTPSEQLYNILSVEAYVSNALDTKSAEETERDLLYLYDIAVKLGADNYNALIDINLQLGVFYNSKNKFILAHHHIKESLELAKKHGNNLAIAHSTWQMSSILNSMGQFKKAIKFALEATAIYEKYDDKHSVLSIMTEIGNAYASLKEYAFAEQYFNEQIKLATAKDLPNIVAYATFEKAKIALERGNPKESLKLLKTIKESVTKDYSFGRPDEYYVLKAKALLAAGEIEKANNLLNKISKGELFSIKNQTEENKLAIQKVWIDTYLALGNSEDALREYQSYNDAYIELNEKKGDQVLHELMIKYKSEQQEITNSKLLAEQNVAQLKLSMEEYKKDEATKKTYILAVLSLISTILIIFFYEYRRYIIRSSSLDPLTKISNRATIIDIGKKIIESKKETYVSVILLDIDNLKAVNDSLGFHVGDQVLRDVANLGGSTLRKGAWFGRHGGKQFIAILPCTNKVQASRVAERMLSNIKGHDWEQYGIETTITSSVGVTSANSRTNTSFEKLVIEADNAMSFAKSHGKNVVIHAHQIPTTN